MPHRLEEAPSGRAKCRGCKRKVEKGSLRLSVAVPNPFGDGESYHHYHLKCAALRQPEAYLELARGPGGEADDSTGPGGEVPADGGIDRAPLQEFLSAAELSSHHRRLRRLVRAERASSGRARCRHCREIIEKGAVRLALEIVDDGMANAAGFVHVTCAGEYIGTTEHVSWLLETQTTDESIDLAEVESSLGASREAKS